VALFYLDASALVKLVRAEPETGALRALDAIHLAAAIDLSPIDAFVSYDERQSAAARLAGLRTVCPGR
jgi:predicted nucleic acid-binding protein